VQNDASLFRSNILYAKITWWTCLTKTDCDIHGPCTTYL